MNAPAEVVNRLRPLAGRKAGPPRVGSQSEGDRAARRSQPPLKLEEAHGEVQRTLTDTAAGGPLIPGIPPARAECRPDCGGSSLDQRR